MEVNMDRNQLVQIVNMEEINYEKIDEVNVNILQMNREVERKEAILRQTLSWLIV